MLTFNIRLLFNHFKRRKTLAAWHHRGNAALRFHSPGTAGSLFSSSRIWGCHALPLVVFVCRGNKGSLRQILTRSVLSRYAPSAPRAASGLPLTG